MADLNLYTLKYNRAVAKRWQIVAKTNVEEQHMSPVLLPKQEQTHLGNQIAKERQVWRLMSQSFKAKYRSQ